MTHRIPRREVLDNLTHFKESLLDNRDSPQSDLDSRVYQALLNFRTGEILFARKFRSLEPHLLPKQKPQSVADWKAVCLSVERDPQKIQFELFDVSNRPLSPAELTPIAWEITTETLDVLNQKALEVSSKWGESFTEEAILQEFFALEAETASIANLPGWRGAIDRFEAEELLWDQKPGTYVLRDGDPITLNTVFHVSEENHFSIQPYILTVVQEDGKISDLLILKTSRGWTSYQDDPDLEDSAQAYYPSPQALLNTLEKVALYPYNVS